MPLGLYPYPCGGKVPRARTQNPFLESLFGETPEAENSTLPFPRKTPTLGCSEEFP